MKVEHCRTSSSIWGGEGVWGAAHNLTTMDCTQVQAKIFDHACQQGRGGVGQRARVQSRPDGGSGLDVR